MGFFTAIYRHLLAFKMSKKWHLQCQKVGILNTKIDASTPKMSLKFYEIDHWYQGLKKDQSALGQDLPTSKLGNLVDKGGGGSQSWVNFASRHL